MTEAEAIKISSELRQKGIITAPGFPFEQSTKNELDRLMESGIFEFLPWDESMRNVRIFNSRIVKTVKGLKTSSPIEKSRLVVQGYKDQGKRMILTQSPTIQKSSQRAILALVPTLQKLGYFLFLRDIKQAYTRSRSYLLRDIRCWPSPEVIEAYGLAPDTIMHVINIKLYLLCNVCDSDKEKSLLGQSIT